MRTEPDYVVIAFRWLCLTTVSSMVSGFMHDGVKRWFRYCGHVAQIRVLLVPALIPIVLSEPRFSICAGVSSVLKVPMTEEQINETLATASSELQYLWRQHKVPRDVQAALIKSGVDDVALFANIGATLD